MKGELVNHPWAFLDGKLYCLDHDEAVELEFDSVEEKSTCPSCGWVTWMGVDSGQVPGLIRAPVPPVE